MAKTLSDIVKNVKSSVKGIGKYASIGAVGLASYLSSPSQAYADKFVNNTMDYTQINDVITDASSGESVHFAEKVYKLLLSVNN